MTTGKKDWILTGEALESLLKYLDSDPNRAAEEYEEIRRRLMKLFRWRGCPHFEEYTDRTIDRVASRIAEGVEIHTTNKYALFYGVALNILKEYWRKSERESHGMDGMRRALGLSGDPEHAIDRQAEEVRQQARIECLRRCLRQLPSESLALIKNYYAEGDFLDKNQRKQLASELRISVNALRVRAFRIRNEVEQCVNVCLKAR